MPNVTSRPPAAPLRLGSSGPQVKALQQQLNAKGQNVAVSGTFGPRTQEAVKRVQLQTGAPASGVVTAATAKKLDSFEAAAPKKLSLGASLTSAISQGVKTAGQNIMQSADLVT